MKNSCIIFSLLLGMSPNLNANKWEPADLDESRPRTLFDATDDPNDTDNIPEELEEIRKTLDEFDPDFIKEFRNLYYDVKKTEGIYLDPIHGAFALSGPRPEVNDIALRAQIAKNAAFVLVVNRQPDDFGNLTKELDDTQRQQLTAKILTYLLEINTSAGNQHFLSAGGKL